jgi:type II secretory ATPase GspE/PulE/Tfp pilus assembly ATPase PilB-like protein
MLSGLGFPFELVSEAEWRFHAAVGCERCGGCGYRGRVGVYELMVITDEMREMILRRTSAAEIGRAARRAGMVPLREDGLAKAAQGITTIEEILRTVV